MENSSKNVKKKIKMFQREHTKSNKYCFIDFQVNTHSSYLLPPHLLHFLKGKN